MPGTITPLGTSAAFPTAEHACACFVLRWKSPSQPGASSSPASPSNDTTSSDATLIIDLGPIPFPSLTSLLPSLRPSGIIITHSHPDHTLTLPLLFRHHLYSSSGLVSLSQPRIPLFCPDDVLTRLSPLEDAVSFTSVFDHAPIPSSPISIGPFTLATFLLPHWVPNAGVRLDVSSPDGRRGLLAYTGDTGPSPLLEELGRDVDLYIVEATDRRGKETKAERNLLTSEEAGYWAARAKAKRLMLTHFWPGNDREEARRKAAKHFKGDIILATEGVGVDLDDS